jgi:hypothetical protein
MGLDWEFVEDGPETADKCDGFCKIAKVDGLDDIGVDAERVSPIEVWLGAGRSHHNDGDVFEAFIGLQAFEKFEAGHSGHFVVEKNDDGTVGSGAFVNGGMENFEGLDAVASDNNRIGELAAFEGSGSEVNIIDIILNEQNRPERARHLDSSLPVLK